MYTNGSSETITGDLISSDIPIIGSRKAHRLEDNLVCLEVSLTADQLQTLDAVSKITLGFPHEFLQMPLPRAGVTAGNDDAIVKR